MLRPNVDVEHVHLDEHKARRDDFLSQLVHSTIKTKSIPTDVGWI